MSFSSPFPCCVSLSQSIPRYTLCADGKLHEADVRAVSTTPDGRLLTASRDKTAQIVFLPADHEDSLVPGLTLLGHEGFVNFVLYHPCLAFIGQGEACVITGSNDNHVAIWNAASSALEGVLDAHSAGVCAGALIGPTSATPFASASASARGAHARDKEAWLSPGWQGDLVTGDWSGRCVVFDHLSGAVKLVYTGHSTAIRALAHVAGTTLVVSVSGDKTAHVWDMRNEGEGGVTRQICMGHEDVVQCLCMMPTCVNDMNMGATNTEHEHEEAGELPAGEVRKKPHSMSHSLSPLGASRTHRNNACFATGSNDGTVRVWSVAVCADSHDSATHDSATVVQHSHTSDVLCGHVSLVYALAWSSTQGELASGSEDHTVLLWRRAATGAGWCRVQVIHHPCVVWGLAYQQQQQQQDDKHEDDEGNDRHAVTPHAVSTSDTAVVVPSSSSSALCCDEHASHAVCARLPQLMSAGSDGVVRVWSRRPPGDGVSTAKQTALEAVVSTQPIDLKVAQSMAVMQEIYADDVAQRVYAEAVLLPDAIPASSSSAYSWVSGLGEPTTLPSAQRLLGIADGATNFSSRSSSSFSFSSSSYAEGTRAFARGEENVVEVYSWSEGRWRRVGVVVSGPMHTPYRADATHTSATGNTLDSSSSHSSSRTKQVYRGVAYDYLFDVDVEGKALKLGYHRGECILAATQRFIDDHRGIVYQDSKEEIQNFLMQNLDPADVARSFQEPSAPNKENTRETNNNNNNNNSNNNNNNKSDTVCAPTWFAKFNVAGAVRRLSAAMSRTDTDEEVQEGDKDDARRTECACGVVQMRQVLEQIAENKAAVPASIMAQVRTVMALRGCVAGKELWVLVDVLRFILAGPARCVVECARDEVQTRRTHTPPHTVAGGSDNNDTNSTNIVNPRVHHVSDDTHHPPTLENEEERARGVNDDEMHDEKHDHDDDYENNESGVRWLYEWLIPHIMTFLSSPQDNSSSSSSSSSASPSLASSLLSLDGEESAAVVTYWLAANAMALLCLATTSHTDLAACDMPDAVSRRCHETMRWGMALVSQVTARARIHVGDRVRAAAGAVLRNAAVLVRVLIRREVCRAGAASARAARVKEKEASVTGASGADACGVELLHVVAHMMIQERSGSAFTVNLLNVLLILFGLCEEEVSSGQRERGGGEDGTRSAECVGDGG